MGSLTMRGRLVFGVSTTAAAVALAAFGLAAGASAAPAAASEDPRAVILDHNVSSCAGAGLAGVIIPESDLEYTGGEENVSLSLTITAVDSDLDVTGIVVKGGDRTNVYEPGLRGLESTPSWEGLRAPLNKGGQIPAISHWFVCGDEQPPTTTTTAPPTTTTEPPTTTTEPPTTTTEPPTTTTEPPTTTTETTTEPPTTTTETTTTTGTTTPPVTTTESTIPSTSTTVPPTTTTTTAPPLASTGFSGGSSLLWAGFLLVLAGGGALAFARSRRA